MNDDRGDGQSKHDSLQQAASIFVDVMVEGDGVGIVRFNEDAQKLQDDFATRRRRTLGHQSQQHERHHQRQRTRSGRRNVHRRRHISKAVAF